MDRENGTAVVHLLDHNRGNIPLHELQNESHVHDTVMAHGGDNGEVLSLYLLCIRQRSTGDAVRELELICTCLKTWVQRYIEVESSGLWMTPVMIFLSVFARRVAASLDQTKRSEANNDAYLKKLVEIHRELFQKLNRVRNKRAGHVWVCCELLRAYFRLGQISQCPFLLNPLSQALNRDGFNPTELPKAIAVTFFLLLGQALCF